LLDESYSQVDATSTLLVRIVLVVISCHHPHGELAANVLLDRLQPGYSREGGHVVSLLDTAFNLGGEADQLTYRSV
jgi:hypothetical protein